MDQNQKCVIVADEQLPLGILVNTAAILGISLGRKQPEVVGCDVVDRSGLTHPGVITFPVPILKADKDHIKQLRQRLYEPEFAEVDTIDFSDLAQGCKNYEEYIEKMKLVEEQELSYYAILLCGPKKKINQLTGSMPLLR